MYKQIETNKRNSVLLLIAFVIAFAIFGYIFGQMYQDGYAISIGAVLFACGSAFVSYFFSDTIVLATSGARQISETDSPEIYHLVENLCITAGIPVPKIYIIPTRALNAFATGRDPQHASIALTAGLIDRLEKAELEGVIAHELSHVLNYDIRFGTLVVVLVGAITMLSNWFFRFSFFGRRRGGDREGGQVMALLALAGLLFAILSPLFARLVQFAISRKREYLADASGSLLTRYPQGLASALRKIAQDTERMPHVDQASASLYFANPLKNFSVSGLFSTHPPIEARIKALEQMGDAK